MSAKKFRTSGKFDGEPCLFWSPSIIRLGSNGNMRECMAKMDRDKAREWCRVNGVLFVDNSERRATPLRK